MVIPLALAVLLNKKFRGGTLFRAVFFAPYVLGVAVIGLLWRYLLDPNVGVVNYYLDAARVRPDPVHHRDAVGVDGAGRARRSGGPPGYNMVIFLAGLQDIPRELYEAAELDGASRWQQFRTRDAARAATGDGVRPHHHDPGLGQRVRAALPDHPGPARRARPARAIMQIGEEGLRELQHGQRVGDEHRAHRGPAGDQPAEPDVPASGRKEKKS